MSSNTFQVVYFDFAAVGSDVVCGDARNRYARLIVDAPTVPGGVVTLRLLEMSVRFALRDEDVTVRIGSVHRLRLLAFVFAGLQLKG